jgi:hypothetical protein
VQQAQVFRLANKVGAAIGDKWQPLRDSPLTEDMGTEFQQRRLINSHAASPFPVQVTGNTEGHLHLEVRAARGTPQRPA